MHLIHLSLSVLKSFITIVGLKFEGPRGFQYHDVFISYTRTRKNNFDLVCFCLFVNFNALKTTQKTTENSENHVPVLSLASE